MARTKRSPDTAVDNPSPIEGLPSPDVAVPILDRLTIVQMQDGFLPTSRGELNEAYNLKTFIDRPGAAGKHIAEVLQHQRKHQVEDPTRAGIHKTRQYASYAQRARTDKTMLLTLREELSELSSANPLSALDRSRLHTGLGQFVRFVDLRELSRTKEFTGFPFSPLRPYSVDMPETYDPYVASQPDVYIDQRIEEVLAKTRVWEAVRDVDSALNDQSARFSFWANRLQEIQKYQTAGIKAVAGEVLQNLGISSPDHV